MARKRKIGKAEKLNRAIERWERKQEGAVVMLRKSAEMLVKLRRQRKRALDKSTAEYFADKRRELSPPPVVGSIAEVASLGSADNEAKAAVEVKTGDDDGGGIPDFLRRGQEAQKRVDEIIDAESKRLASLPNPNSPEKRAARRTVEKQTREANLRGQTRRMPLSGRAALDAIRNKPE